MGGNFYFQYKICLDVQNVAKLVSHTCYQVVDHYVVLLWHALTRVLIVLHSAGMLISLINTSTFRY